MDQKHRDYCIRLGNPYYIKEEAKPQYEEINEDSFDNFQIKVENNTTGEDWLKNNNKFTN